MKIVMLVFVALGAYLLNFGTPLPVDVPDVDTHWGSLEPVLPMTFAHEDHVSEGCIGCHHNYIDDTGITLCMNCHVTDDRVAYKLRQQFHKLCMGCHLERTQDGDDSGPPRRCIECHMTEDLP